MPGVLLKDTTLAGITMKSPKQVLLEFYGQYPEAQKPTFQVVDVPGALPSDNVQYRATVVCPAVHRSPGDLAFEDLMFEGVGRSKKTAEHDCADKAYAFIRNLPGLKLPSGSLSLGAGSALQAAVQMQGVIPTAVTLNPVSPVPMSAAAAAPMQSPVGLTINEAMIESMTQEQLKMALKEVLGLYKTLVQAVHGEMQRHAADMHAIIMRQL